MAPWLAWLALLAWAAAAHADPAPPQWAPQGLLVRKCCPEGQTLDAALIGCEGSADARPERRPAAGLSESAAAWLEPSAVATLMAAPPHGRYLELGTALPCHGSTTMVVRAAAAGSHRLLPNGTLLLGQGQALPPEAYCGDSARGRFFYLACVCLAPGAACVRKCCAAGSGLRLNRGRKSDATECVSEADSEPWAPPFDGAAPAAALQFFRPLQCEPERLPVLRLWEGAGEQFRLFANGSVLVSDLGRGVAFEPRHACVDRVADREGGGSVAFVCAPTVRPEPVSGERRAYGAVFAVTSMFLAATLLVFAALPEVRNASYRLEVSHTASMLVGSLTLVGAYFLSVVPYPLCYAEEIRRLCMSMQWRRKIVTYIVYCIIFTLVATATQFLSFNNFYYLSKDNVSYR